MSLEAYAAYVTAFAFGCRKCLVLAGAWVALVARAAYALLWLFGSCVAAGWSSRTAWLREAILAHVGLLRVCVLHFAVVAVWILQLVQ